MDPSVWAQGAGRFYRTRTNVLTLQFPEPLKTTGPGPLQHDTGLTTYVPGDRGVGGTKDLLR